MAIFFIENRNSGQRIELNFQLDTIRLDHPYIFTFIFFHLIINSIYNYLLNYMADYKNKKENLLIL